MCWGFKELAHGFGGCSVVHREITFSLSSLLVHLYTTAGFTLCLLNTASCWSHRGLLNWWFKNKTWTQSLNVPIIIFQLTLFLPTASRGQNYRTTFLYAQLFFTTTLNAKHEDAVTVLLSQGASPVWATQLKQQQQNSDGRVWLDLLALWLCFCTCKWVFVCVCLFRESLRAFRVRMSRRADRKFVIFDPGLCPDQNM